MIADGLRQLRPDVVGFQEAVVNGDYDQVSDVLGPDYDVAHQGEREVAQGDDVEEGQGFSIASRWPIRDVRELDLHVTPRTADFACATLVAEILAPDPFAPLLLVYHNPSWKPNLERERELQAVAAARFIEDRVGDRSMHVVVFGDLDADPEATSVRFWTGHASLDGTSVCYRDAWASAHPGEPGDTFTPRNPLVRDHDWPFRRIDYILVGCGEHGGPTLEISSCELIFDEPVDGVWASDHFGLVADLTVPNDRA